MVTTDLPSNSLRARLKEQTAFAHKQLEDTLDILNPQMSAERYEKILEAFYFLYSTFEKHLEERALEGCEASQFYIKDRQKTNFLIQDLESHIHTLKPGTVDSTDFSWLDSTNKVWGALYVVEGSTLGGAVISKHFCDTKITEDSRYGHRFFESYQSETGKRWRDFLAQLEGAALQPGTIEAVAAANRMFHCFSSYFEDYLN